MILDLTIADKIKQLHREGLRPSEGLVKTITRAGAVAFTPLLDLATQVELLHEDEPECYAPIHALRLLGEVGELEMIEPLLREYPVELDYEDEELPQMWVEEAPQIIGRLGEATVESLWRIAGDEAWPIVARSSALIALTYVTAVAPATRDALIAALRERLATAEDKAYASHLVIALANLGVNDAYAEVMALYRAGRIDQEIIPAGAVRQLLLTDSSKRLACANHPLWERYDQHGPFPEEREI
jgi:hypothetical protein